MEYSVELYENSNGRRIVEEELEEIESRTPELFYLVVAGLNKLRNRQYHKPPLCLKLDDDLFELRVGGKNIARAIWFFQHNQRIVVVRCFVKKTQKTPENEIRIAQARRNDYLERYKHGG